MLFAEVTDLAETTDLEWGLTESVLTLDFTRSPSWI
jgi:hypothetical protein